MILTKTLWAFALVGAIWAGPRYVALREHAAIGDDLRTLENMNHDLEARAHRLELEIVSMRRSAAYREWVVRDELNYVRPGEIVLVDVHGMVR